MKVRLQKIIRDLQKKEKRGFTLKEVFVVLVILATTVPVINSYIREANDVKYLAQARVVFVVAEVEKATVEANSSTVDWSTTNTTKANIEISDLVYDRVKYTLTISDGNQDNEVTGNDKIEVN